MDIQRNETLIGKGVLFPIKLSQNPRDPSQQGWYPVTGSVDLINNNLKSLFEYQIGQRFRQEYYGSRLWECLEEPSVPLLLYLVNQFIKDSIEEWEERINFRKVEGYIEGSKIILRLTYYIKQDSNQQQLEIQFKDTFNT